MTLLIVGSVMFVVGLAVATISYYATKKQSSWENPGMVAAVIGFILLIVWAASRICGFHH